MQRLAVVLVALLTALPAQEVSQSVKAGERKALVIGNKSYTNGPLMNPVNDAKDLSAALKELGFSVDMVVDANRQAMAEATTSFAAKLSAGDTALFYYAGHGVQIDSENYLLPVDLSAETEAALRQKALPFSTVKSALERSPAKLTMMIFDACRDNPLQTTTLTQGIAPLEAGLGAYIVFAASPGKTASDNRRGRNGLFATHLLEALKQPLNVSDLFRTVRKDVYAASGGRQLPYIHDQALGDFYLRPSGIAATVDVTAVSVATRSGERDLQQAKVLLNEGRCKESLDVLDPLLRRDPQNPFVRNAAGLSYLCTGMASVALEQFSRAIELKPDYAAAYWNRGQVFLRATQYNLAIDDFNWALEQDSENPLLYWRRGRAYFGLRQYEKALNDFTEAIRVDPGSPYGYDGRGQVQHQFGRYQQAEADFSAAIARKRDYGEAYLHRARTRERLGDRAGADADHQSAKRYPAARFQ